MADSAPPTSSSSRKALLYEGISASSLPTVRRVLADLQSSPSSYPRNTLPRALDRAVAEGKSEIVRLLLEETGVPVEGVGLRSVGKAAEEAGEGDVVEVFEVLVSKGWDLNGREDGVYSTDGQHPIYRVCHSERLVRWFLSHNARLTFPGPDVRGKPPLLEVVARRGSVATFKLLMEHGAPRGLRCLHAAAESATFAERDKEQEKESQRMEMARFLVEEIGCDVNGMDVPEGVMPGNHYGTPLNYAAHTGGGAEVARYLLDKGADPRITDCYGVGDAFIFAKGNNRVTELLAKWKEENDGEKT